MSHLVPCPHCSRHVRHSESSCPFCSAALALAHVPPPALPRSRLGRAATFAFGATLAGATSLVACGGESEERKPGEGGTSAGGTSAGGTNAGGTNAGGKSSGGKSSGGTNAGGTNAGGDGMSAGTSNSMGGNIAPPYGIPPLGGETSAPVYGAPPAGMSSGGAAGGGDNTSGSGSGVPLYGAAPQD